MIHVAEALARALAHLTPPITTSTTMLTIIVRGNPAPQGSKSFKGMINGRAVLAESSKHVKPWRMDVKEAAQNTIGHADPLDGPLMVHMVFTLPKPSAAPKTKRTWPMRLPDLSKLVRSTEDALTDAGVWADDARVIRCVADKVYPNEGDHALPSPGCVIHIFRVTEVAPMPLPLLPISRSATARTGPQASLLGEPA